MTKTERWVAAVAVATVVVVAAGYALAQNVLNYREQGGERWVIGGSLDVASGGDLDIESGGVLKVAGSDITPELAIMDGVTASTADLNATTNFEETISATTSEVTITAAKTLDVPAGNLQINDVAVTATAGELNYTDVTTAGTAEASKAVVTDSSIDVTGLRNLTLTGDVVVSAPTDGGDAGARNTVTANFNIAAVAFGTMTNGSTETIELTDDTPAGECAGVNQTTANDATVYRVGTNSLKVTFASSPSAADGADCTLSGADNFESNESVGFWFRTDTALSAGDVYAELDDDGGTDVTFDLPAVATINQWTWIELDVTTCATCDIVDAIKFLIDAGGATTLAAGGNIWVDFAHKWDADDEETLGVDVVQDGVLGVITSIAADAGTQVHDTTSKVENTDFFINYQAGSDVWVTLADLSTFTGFVLLATQ